LSGPLPRRIERRTSAVTIASSAWPATGEEVGDQVQGHREVRDQPCEQELVPPRQLVVLAEASHEHDAVGDEPGESTGILPPPQRNQDGGARRVDDEHRR
jgi:hypothetical protein